MSEDRLLRDLGHLEREEKKAEQSRLDERWDRMAAGTLTAEEDAELRALAETSSEVCEAYEAFRPLGAEFQARVVDRLAAEIEQPEPVAESQEPRSRILPFRPATFRFAGWLTGAAAAAAAVLLLLLRSPAAMPPLPTYKVASLTGGFKEFRGEARPEIPVFRPGTRLAVVVRPVHSVTGPVRTQAFFARGAEWVAWNPEIEGDGSVRLRGELGREIRPGEWRLWVIVGRPGRIPPTAELQTEIRAGRLRHDMWQAVHTDLRVESDPPP